MNVFQEVDQYGQELVISQLEKIFSGQTLTFDQHIDDKGAVDIFFTATTTNGNQYTYAVECKDRHYSHNYSDEWFIEVHKYEDLMSTTERGDRPLYINTYKDKWINVWDLSKVTLKEEERELSKASVVDRGKSKRKVYTLQTSQCVYSHKFI